MMDRKEREVVEKLGDGTEITYVCWEEDGSRGFYDKALREESSGK